MFNNQLLSGGRTTKNLFFPIGGGNEIGASCYFIELNGAKLLLDSGIRLHSDSTFPRFDSLYAQNHLDGLWELEGILLSHGHLDHVGSLPNVVAEAPDVPIYATQATHDIMEMQLGQAIGGDSGPDATFQDFREVQQFNANRVEHALESVRFVEWNEPFLLEYEGKVRYPPVQVTFYPAGHILGASMIYVQSDAGNILFSGDFTPFDQLTVPKYQIPNNLEVDLLIAESTYGYQEGTFAGSVAEEREIFAQKIERCLNNKGSVLIPAFAIGRSQELALILQNLIHSGRLIPFTIYIDGLAQTACEIYQNNGVRVFGYQVGKAPRSLIENLDSFNGVLIASSGMLLDKSASARYAEKLLPDARNAIFFSGYLDEESPGRRLERLHQSRGQRFRLNDRSVPVRADVDTYRLSAHTDSEGILSLIEKVYPKKVVFVHGYPQQRTVVNVYSETFRRFGRDIEVYQATNGTPIYF